MDNASLLSAIRTYLAITISNCLQNCAYCTALGGTLHMNISLYLLRQQYVYFI